MFDIAALFFILLLGLATGSFLNVCIGRLPRGQSIISPPSHCPNCGKRLSAADLIPVIGFILLEGRCRYCKVSISVQYPLVELLTASIFLLIYLKYSLSLETLSYAVFASFMIVASFIDLNTMEIPDLIAVLGAAFGLFFSLFTGSAINCLLAAALGFSTIHIISIIARLIFRREAVGEGDAYIAMMVGANLGSIGLFEALYLAALIGGAVALLLILLRKKGFGQEIPFVPIMGAASLAYLLFGCQLINWYLGML